MQGLDRDEQLELLQKIKDDLHSIESPKSIIPANQVLKSNGIRDKFRRVNGKYGVFYRLPGTNLCLVLNNYGDHFYYIVEDNPFDLGYQMANIKRKEEL